MPPRINPSRNPNNETPPPPPPQPPTPQFDTTALNVDVAAAVATAMDQLMGFSHKNFPMCACKTLMLGSRLSNKHASNPRLLMTN